MTLTQLFTSIANAIRSKKGTSATIVAEDFPTEISSIQTGITPTGTINITQNGTTDVTNYASANVSVSGGGTSEKDVNFYDYDGTLLYSYSKTEFLALTEMPANPTHTGLTAQGWNWDLTDAKSYVTDYGMIDIGQTYTTASGLSEFFIELNNKTGLTVTLNLDGTKNWGDGTSDTNTTHTYSNVGEYIITCNGATANTTSSSGLFGQSSSNINYYLKEARIVGINTIPQYAFHYCNYLKNIILPENVTQISYYGLRYTYCLECIIFPKNFTKVETNSLQNCYLLKKIIFPKSFSTMSSTPPFTGNAFCERIIVPNSVTILNSSNFTYYYNLKKVILPDTITKMSSNFTYCCNLTSIIIPSNCSTIQNCFQSCFLLTKFDFTKCQAVPSLSNSTSLGLLNPNVKIIVPNSLYSSWITTTNWTNYTDNIIKESDYNAS